MPVQTVLVYGVLIASCCLAGCDQSPTVAPQVVEHDENRRRTIVITTDEPTSAALDENVELAALFANVHDENLHQLAEASRRIGAEATGEFYELAAQHSRTGFTSGQGVKPPLAPRALPCLYAPTGDASEKERALALALNSEPVQRGSDHIAERYEDALRSFPNDCRLLAGWALAVLQSSEMSPPATRELAVRRLLELATGNVTPSRHEAVDVYTVLAEYFAARDQVPSAVAAIDYALRALEASGDRERQAQLETWRRRVIQAAQA